MVLPQRRVGTDVTLVGGKLVPRVGQEVLLEGVGLYEPCRTVLAGVGSLSGVSADVYLQVVLPAGGVGAEGTLVQLGAGG